MFIGSVETWLLEQVGEREAEHAHRIAAVANEQKKLADLDCQREKHFAEYRKLVEAGDELARYALEEVQCIDRERDAQQKLIAEAEAIVSEWSGPPDLDAALDFYRELVDLVNDKVRKARGAEALNAALREVLAAIYVGIHTGPLNAGRLQAGFELRVPTSTQGGA